MIIYIDLPVQRYWFSMATLNNPRVNEKNNWKNSNKLCKIPWLQTRSPFLDIIYIYYLIQYYWRWFKQYGQNGQIAMLYRLTSSLSPFLCSKMADYMYIYICMYIQYYIHLYPHCTTAMVGRHPSFCWLILNMLDLLANTVLCSNTSAIWFNISYCVI